MVDDDDDDSSASSWFRRDSGGAAGWWPSSANFFNMFSTVGTNFVDIDMIPGSCIGTIMWSVSDLEFEEIFKKNLGNVYYHSQRHFERFLLYPIAPRELLIEGIGQIGYQGKMDSCN